MIVYPVTLMYCLELNDLMFFMSSYKNPCDHFHILNLIRITPDLAPPNHHSARINLQRNTSIDYLGFGTLFPLILLLHQLNCP